MNLAGYCQTSSTQQLFFLTLFEAWVARGVHLCFGSRPKKFGNRWSSHSSV